MFDLVLEADYSKIKKTSVIINDVYPVIEKAIASRTSQVKKCISDFITAKYSSLYDNAPYDRITFTANEFNEFWKAIGIPESQIDNIMKNCFFYNIPYNPRAAKSPFVASVMMCIRYFLKKNDQKNAELFTIYLAFSGQFYPSIHSRLWKFMPRREVMEYVVNYKMTDKFDLRKTGNLFSSIRNICLTWLKTYSKTIASKDLDDDGYGTLVQQLHDREKSFLYNIASLYYEAIDNEEYMNYTSDNLDPEEFRLNDTNVSRVSKYVDATIQLMTTTDIDYKFCGMVCDQNVKKDEVKNIMESIFHNRENIPDMTEAVDIIINDFFKTYPKESIHSVKFLTHAMTTKPNTKDKHLLRLREIILKWLNENSVDYVRRKSRKSTAVSYYKAILKMLVLYINKANK